MHLIKVPFSHPVFFYNCLPKQVESGLSLQACLLFGYESTSLSSWTRLKTLLKLSGCSKLSEVAVLNESGLSTTESSSATENGTLFKKKRPRRSAATVKRVARLSKKPAKKSLASGVTKKDSLIQSSWDIEKARAHLEQLGVEEPALFKCIVQNAPPNVPKGDIVSSVSTLMAITRAGWNDILIMLSKVPALLTVDSSKMQAKVRLLMDLGMDQNAVSKILLAYPALLEYDVEEMRGLVDYLLSVGIAKECIPRIMAKRPQVFATKMEDVKYVIGCFLEVKMPPEDLVRMIVKVPELFSSQTIRNLNSRLEFFKQVGLYGGPLGKGIARRPSLLNFDLERMKQSYSYLSEFLDHKDLAKLLCRFAEVLVIDVTRKMEPMVNCLLRLGVKESHIGKVLLRRPQLLGYTIRGLDPAVEYLKELGVKGHKLGRVISISPQVLTMNSEVKLKPVIDYLRSIGLTDKKDMEKLLVRHAQVLCCSIENNFAPKFKFFVNMGIPAKDVISMLVLFPSMFGQSIMSGLDPKSKYLVDVMKRSPEEIIDFPQYFGYSLEKRIKPRFEKLKARGMTHISLASMLTCVDADFISRYLDDTPVGCKAKKVAHRSKYVE